MQALLTWQAAADPNQASLAAFIEDILGDLRGCTLKGDYSRLSGIVELLRRAGADNSSTDKTIYIISPEQFTQSIGGDPSASDYCLCLCSQESAVQYVSLQNFIVWAKAKNCQAIISMNDVIEEELEQSWRKLQTVLAASVKHVNPEIAERQAEVLGRKLGEQVGVYVERGIEDGLKRLDLGGVREMARQTNELVESVGQLASTVQHELFLEAELLKLDKDLGQLEQQLEHAIPLQVSFGLTEPTYFLILRMPAYFEPLEILIETQPPIEGLPTRIIMTRDMMYIPTGLTVGSLPEEGAKIQFLHQVPNKKTLFPLTTDPFCLSRSYLASLTNIDLQKDFARLDQEQVFLQAFAQVYRNANGPEATPPFSKASGHFDIDPTITPEAAFNKLFT